MKLKPVKFKTRADIDCGCCWSALLSDNVEVRVTKHSNGKWVARAFFFSDEVSSKAEATKLLENVVKKLKVT